MSATDELRRLLDERGVEYEAYRDVKNRCITKWRTHHGAFVFFAVEKEGKLFVETASDTKHSAICTPDQAIAATLGDHERTCHETTVDKFFRGCGSCDWMWEVFYSFGKRERPNYCPNCGAKVVSE